MGVGWEGGEAGVNKARHAQAGAQSPRRKKKQAGHRRGAALRLRGRRHRKRGALREFRSPPAPQRPSPCEKTKTGRPPTVPLPVTTPSPKGCCRSMPKSTQPARSTGSTQAQPQRRRLPENAQGASPKRPKKTKYMLYPRRGRGGALLERRPY
jgi:hypothetical protein